MKTVQDFVRIPPGSVLGENQHDGVSKLTSLRLLAAQDQHEENFRELLKAMSKDLRVILVKLADRLHNMRTIRSMTSDKQVLKARETMEIFAPIAGCIGMQWMREELEDLSFKVLNPEARNSIIRRFLTLQRELGDVIHKITADIRHELEKAQIDATVYGVAKKPFAIWNKMLRGDVELSRLSDIYGFRVVCHSVKDCYRIKDIVHEHWLGKPDEFEDYIRNPIANGNRSLQTTVSGPGGRHIELHICTGEMHDAAAGGVLLHWSFRDGARLRNAISDDLVEKIIKSLEHLGEAENQLFLDETWKEIFPDSIFCFGPSGNVLRLPSGATPLHFAYALSTKIGNSTVSAKVDGVRVPLRFPLKNGNSVEVITAAKYGAGILWFDNLSGEGKPKRPRKVKRTKDRK